MLKRLIRGIVSIVIISCFLLILFLGFKSLVDASPSFFDLDAFLKNFSIKIPSESREELNQIPLGEPKNMVLKIGLFADSEGDWNNLHKALIRMEDLSVDVGFFLGDLTRWGSREELLGGKEILDSSAFEIFVIPGDHDLAASVAAGDLTGLQYFTDVFGPNRHIYEKSGYKFLLFDNSANFSPLSDSDFNWFRDTVGQVNFVILSQPLYHPVNTRVMGMVEGKIVSNVHSQAQEMLSIIRESRVRAIISADQHMFSNSMDPEEVSLRHIVIGALVSNDEELRNPQAPRFAILEVYSDGSYKVDEVVL